jgi:hypothetical protein
MTSTLVRDRELHSLVMDLDAATEILESIGFRGTDDDTLSLPLREAFALKHAVQAAADFLYALRYAGGGRP